MRVWEKINELKGTNATMKQISDWAYMNRICPTSFEEGLELDIEYPKKLEAIARQWCHISCCGVDCLNSFLNDEYADINL